MDRESLLVLLEKQWLVLRLQSSQLGLVKKNLLRAAGPQVILIHPDKMKIFRAEEWSQELRNFVV